MPSACAGSWKTGRWRSLFVNSWRPRTFHWHLKRPLRSVRPVKHVVLAVAANQTMIRSAITLSLAPELKGGPFVLWGDLPGNCAKAAALGFDAVELFVRSAEDLNPTELRAVLDQNNLGVSAFGTGTGWVIHKLRFSDPDPHIRRKAHDFVGSMIDFAAAFGAPAIIGSMQGRSEGEVSREQALDWLREALELLGPRALAAGGPLLFEPLNRYETNLVMSITYGIELLRPLHTQNVKLLCDLFHANLEEANIADSIRQAGTLIGHVHFVDSNRRAVGFGHTEMRPIVKALRDIGYSGYVSSEALPWPDSEAAAAQAVKAYKELFDGTEASR